MNADLAKYDRHHDTNYHDLYSCLQSQVLYVVDENGVNMADAQVRHIEGRHWLYVDGVDGFEVMHENSLSSLNLVTERPTLGYSATGEVVEA